MGIAADKELQKKVHKSITLEKPAHIPKLKGNAFRNPSLLPLDIDIILLGPGVTAVTIAYDKKFNH